MRAWDFLPGSLWVERGCARDYMELARFHYCGGRPATWANVVVAKYEGGRMKEEGGGMKEERRGGDLVHPSSFNVHPCRVVAVGVLSWPTVRLGVRERYLGMEGWGERERIEFANAHVRTISRVVVHPQFRGIGLAAEVVRCLLRGCDTRYVEAIAAMGRVHPFFIKGGMERVKHEEGRGYFVFDRERAI